MALLKNYWLYAMVGVAFLLGGSKAYLDHVIQTELAAGLKALPPTATITYGTAYLTWRGGVAIQDVQIQLPATPAIRIKTIYLDEVYRFYTMAQLPSVIALRLQDISVRLPDIAVQTPTDLHAIGYADYFLDFQDLHRLGYSTVQADAHLMALTQAAQTHATLTVDAGGWGHLQIQADLQKVPPPIDWSTEWQQLEIADISGQYQNRGLLNRAITLLAQRQQTTTTALQHRLSNQLQNDLRLVGVEAEVIDQLRAFIETLTQLQIDYTFSPALRVG